MNLKKFYGDLLTTLSVGRIEQKLIKYFYILFGIWLVLFIIIFAVIGAPNHTGSKLSFFGVRYLDLGGICFGLIICVMTFTKLTKIAWFLKDVTVIKILYLCLAFFILIFSQSESRKILFSIFGFAPSFLPSTLAVLTFFMVVINWIFLIAIATMSLLGILSFGLFFVGLIYPIFFHNNRRKADTMISNINFYILGGFICIALVTLYTGWSLQWYVNNPKFIKKTALELDYFSTLSLSTLTCPNLIPPDKFIPLNDDFISVYKVSPFKAGGTFTIEKCNTYQLYQSSNNAS
jgi:hypothetical protein